MAQQMAGCVSLEGVQAKVKEPELRDGEHSWVLLPSCARGASGSHPISSPPAEDVASDPHQDR